MWQAPAVLPAVIDDPEAYLPEALPPADLILSFAEHKGVAELLPDIARRTAAKAVVIPSILIPMAQHRMQIGEEHPYQRLSQAAALHVCLADDLIRLV